MVNAAVGISNERVQRSRVTLHNRLFQAKWSLELARRAKLFFMLTQRSGYFVSQFFLWSVVCC